MGFFKDCEDAYEAQDLLPCCDDYYIERPGVNFVCPLTACALQAGQASLKNIILLKEQVFSWAVMRFGLDWTEGFMVGLAGVAVEDDGIQYFLGHLNGTIMRGKILEL